jgi:hypothetical protein
LSPILAETPKGSLQKRTEIFHSCFVPPNAAFTTTLLLLRTGVVPDNFLLTTKLCIVFQSPNLPPLWQFERVVKAQTPKENAL